MANIYIGDANIADIADNGFDFYKVSAVLVA